jgi:hypoxanthine phosphoribosyltransferase
MSMDKVFVRPDEYYQMSTELAIKLLEQGVLPDIVVGIWRGGALPAMVVHELYAALGHQCDHLCVRAASYVAIGEQSEVNLSGFEPLFDYTERDVTILWVDDIVDSGRTFAAINSWCETHLPHAKQQFAAVYGRNHETFSAVVACKNDAWLVFPHELQDLTASEFAQHSHLNRSLLARIDAFRKDKR